MSFVLQSLSICRFHKISSYTHHIISSASLMHIRTFMNRATATIMTSTFLTVANAMSWSGFFILLAIVCLLILAWMYVYLPETKGRPLEDMSQFFAEITGDRSIVEAEEALRTKDAASMASTLVPEMELNSLQSQTNTSKKDYAQIVSEANVVGIMA